MAKQRFQHGHIPPFHYSTEPYGRCSKCKEIARLNVFNRCPDCELAFQKDVLLETIAAIKPMDAETNALLLTEYRLRADELLARGKSA